MASSPHPPLAKNLVLIGGRGCGKSSIAKRLARTNRHFILFSVDGLIRYEAGGRGIPELVEAEGWAGFRARERAVVEKLAGFRGGALIDTGGGVVAELDEAGRERFSAEKVGALRRHGLVVYLQRSLGYLESRVGVDPNRPALSSQESFREIMERREAWYERAADWVLPCDDRPKNDLSSQILAWFYRELGVKGGQGA